MPRRVHDAWSELGYGGAMARFAVVGSGAWGTALAAHAARLDHAVTMWALEPEVADDITTRHRNSVYLPDLALPDTLRATTDVATAVAGAEVVLLVPPSSHLRSVAHQVGPALEPNAMLVVATKGIEEGSLKLMSEVLAETIPDLGERLAFLSGPSFAKEVARGLPTDVVVAAENIEIARRIQRLVHAPEFRTYSSADPVGVQVGGAVKNVLAIATGACDGLGFGDNARAAVITRGLAEMTRLGVALGANPLTFLGLSGVGDLMLTCAGDLSRNRTLGKQLALGVDPKEYLASRRSVAEGFSTSAAATALARKIGVEMPITEGVYEVLHRGRPLKEAVRMLMERGYKDELHGIAK